LIEAPQWPKSRVNPMSITDLQSRVKAIKELLGAFKYERMVYVVVTLISVIVLLSCAVAMLLRSDGQPMLVLGLFGGSGGILYTSGRLLKMWSDALGILGQLPQGGGE
jgi:hypothetical protein